VRRAALLLGLLLVLPGSGRTAVPPEPVRIIAFGDFGTGGATQRRFGEAVRRFEARNGGDWLVTLGDNDYTARPPAFRANWAASFGWTTGAVRVAGVLGNHDVQVDGGRYQFEALDMPGRYYKRSAGLVDLFLLDSNSIDPRQTAWLSQALARSGARWKIAVFHHPAFSCGAYRSHPGVVSRWVPLFERHGVRLVLSGHDHNYQRFTARRGVSYVVHGGGGRRLYPLMGCPAGYPRRVRSRAEHGFLYLVVRSGRLDGYAVTPAGRRTDHFSLARIDGDG
jgi:tartrate-resistant acid phosphatase type 5